MDYFSLAKEGNLLSILTCKKYDWNIIGNIAAYYGHIHIIKYILYHRIPIDLYILSGYAILGGYKDIYDLIPEQYRNNHITEEIIMTDLIENMAIE